MSVRVTEAQAAELFGRTVAGLDTLRTQKPAKRPARRRESLPENQVEAQILGFLRARGWLVERQQAGVVIGIGPLLAALDRGQPITRELLYRSMIRQGENGRADWVAVRAAELIQGAGEFVRLYQRIEIEVKAPGKKPSPEQAKYLRDRQACGFLCGWWDSIEAFTAWYGTRFP